MGCLSFFERGYHSLLAARLVLLLYYLGLIGFHTLRLIRRVNFCLSRLYLWKGFCEHNHPTLVNFRGQDAKKCSLNLCLPSEGPCKASKWAPPWYSWPLASRSNDPIPMTQNQGQNLKAKGQLLYHVGARFQALYMGILMPASDLGSISSTSGFEHCVPLITYDFLHSNISLWLYLSLGPRATDFCL